jgi:hypothetical protein
MPPNTVTVTRPSPWGNPYVVGPHGTHDHVVELHKQLLVNGVIVDDWGRVFEETQRNYRDFVCQNISSLKGKDLACWCRLEESCHADILIELANLSGP